MSFERVRPVDRRAPKSAERQVVEPARPTHSILPDSAVDRVRPAGAVGVMVEPATSKIRRSTYAPLAVHANPLPKMRRSAEKDVIRRVISDDEWKDRIGPVVKADKEFIIWQGTQGIVLRMNEVDVKGKFQKRLQYKNVGTSDDYFADVTKTDVDGFKADSTLLPEHLAKAATFDAKRSDDIPIGGKKPEKAPEFVVTEFANEPLSLVHHTIGTAKEKNPHLTVENAHVAAVKDLFDPKTRDVKSKAAEDKGTINARLNTAHGVGSVDNLNFFPAPSKKGKTDLDGLHGGLSLADYLTFLSNALKEGGLPVEYGTRITQMATQMASLQRLDMSQMFMRVDMDEKAFVRAVLIIDSVLSKKLAIPDVVRKTFARWWDQGASPMLPEPEMAIDDVKETDWVASGKMGKTESYSVIEGKLAKRHFAAVSAAAKSYPPPTVVAQIRADQAVVDPGK